MAPTQEGIKTLKQRRTTIKGQCTTTQTYIKNGSACQASAIELRARLQRFSSIWDEFNDVQSKIEMHEAEEQGESSQGGISAAQDEERLAFEDKYFTIITSLESLIEEKASLPIPHIALDRQVREGTPMTHTMSAVNYSLKLPRVNLPVFTDKYEDWTSFYNMFHSMIHQNAALPDVQNIQYLLSSLKGEAYDIISSLEASAENYKKA